MPVAQVIRAQAAIKNIAIKNLKKMLCGCITSFYAGHTSVLNCCFSCFKLWRWFDMGLA